ncbi:hypothetical protein C810_01421 [Lachnospiraceae bacterium A2]|nr:hypothetical protein C810_01421 [Lachnospiraceae bacterium A2]
MNEIIKINNHDVEVKEYKGQRVVTFKDIDTVHERPAGTAKRNFNDNKKHFIEGEDFFAIPYSEFCTEFVPNPPKGGNPNVPVNLMTEQGYLMLVKSLTDDLAWKVQRELVNGYFRAKKAKSAIEELQELQSRAILEVNEKVGEVENRITRLENNMTITHEQIQIIKNRVNARIVNDVLGGYESNAYNDVHLRSKVYSRFNKDYCDYFRINARTNTLASKFDEALRYIDMWEPDTNMKLMIQNANAQMKIEDIA